MRIEGDLGFYVSGHSLYHGRRTDPLANTGQASRAPQGTARRPSVRRGRGGDQCGLSGRGREKALAQLGALEHAGLEVVPLDIGLARDAGFLRCVHRDLPMADCVIAATALRLGGRVVTNDPHFSKVKGLRTTWI